VNESLDLQTGWSGSTNNFFLHRLSECTNIDIQPRFLWGDLTNTIARVDRQRRRCLLWQYRHRQWSLHLQRLKRFCFSILQKSNDVISRLEWNSIPNIFRQSWWRAQNSFPAKDLQSSNTQRKNLWGPSLLCRVMWRRTPRRSLCCKRVEGSIHPRTCARRLNFCGELICACKI